MVHILYEDAQILVVQKPGGVAVQTGRLAQKDMVSILKNYRADNREEPYIGVVHRLDQPVEGVMVFAKTAAAAAGLSGQFEKGKAEKYYRAVVLNRMEEPLLEGAGAVLTDYLIKDGRNNVSKVVPPGTKGAKKAVLQYTVVKAGEELAKLDIRLETGRHHQIRVQMANAGFPLLFDHKYGPKDLRREAAGQIALCAAKICFLHPGTGERMEFEAAPENPAFFRM